ncbi:hypothetical protein [Saccharibacillus sp. JS10]|uniref:hypothetical protein n=1 Tax=Saccharibacillus sp. JS10 TaxID=2950552 RepID=UPI00210AFB73|nr:hypothetical protein [Saccharibacillus sp. JS10]MCQ4086633.1 hypothetical protein [Saccharibacillus sp. JS10]
MLRATDHDTENKLRNLRKEQPNYDVMWNKIRLEADKRGSGWQTSEDLSRSNSNRRKRWILPIAYASLAAVIVIGAAASQGYWKSLQPEASASAVGQALEAQAEVDGIVLKVNNVVQGGERRFGQSDAEEQMKLHVSLSGLSDEDIQIAAFDKSSITDLDTGKKLDMQMAEFNIGDVRNVEDWQNNRTLNTLSVVTGDFNSTPGEHRYRLEMSDLWMIRHTKVPIEGKLKSGQEYTVLPDQDFKIKVTDIDWDASKKTLKVKFLPNSNAPQLDTEDENLFTMDRMSTISLQSGDKQISYSGFSAPDRSKTSDGLWEGEYVIREGLTEDQLSDLTMTYSYPEKVRAIKGPWNIDFTLDSSKSEIPTETVPIQDARDFTAQSGWTLGNALIDPYSIAIPVYRGEKSRALQDGEIVRFANISLTDGVVTMSGMQDPTPDTIQQQERENEQEFIKFGIQGMAKNDKQDQMTYDYWDSYDFRGKPLTASFDGAWIAHIEPNHWTKIDAPTAEQETVSDTLAEDKQVQYLVHRKGKDVFLQTRVPEGLWIYEGTSLQVDGQVYKFDENAIEEQSVQDEQGNYHRVDVYRNIPEGKEFAIQMLGYGTLDPTKKAKVVIR